MTPTLSFIVAGGTPGDRGRFVQALERQSLPAAQVEVLTAKPGPGVGAAWNAAARTAGGRLLVFTRADFVPTLDFAEAHLRLHQRSDAALGIGRLRRPPGRSALTAYAGEGWQADRESLWADGGVPLLAAAGSPLSLSRERFAATGGFAEGLEWGLEIDLALRAAAQGARPSRTEAVVGELPPYRSAGEALRDAERQGRGSVLLYGHAPETLPHLELGTYAAAGAAARALRGRLLALGVPAAVLAGGGMLLPGTERRGRWHRFLLGYAFWRGVWSALPDAETRRRLRFPPLILMYHAVGAEGEAAGRYIVPARRFAAQMRWLRRRGYQAVRLDELLDQRRQFRLPPARAVAVTFDDGYEDNYHQAFPRLRTAGMPATFFLVSAELGGVNRWDREGELAGRALLGVEQAREMAAAGMEIGGHTRHHVPLSETPESALEEEITGCRSELERILGVPVRSFAYPYGKMSEPARAAVERGGYQGAVCSRSGANDPAAPGFALRRLEVRGTDTLAGFALTLWRGRARRRTERGR